MTICPHCRAFIALDLARSPKKFQMSNVIHIVKMRPYLEEYSTEERINLIRDMFMRTEPFIREIKRKNYLLSLRWLNNRNVFFETKNENK